MPAEWIRPVNGDETSSLDDRMREAPQRRDVITLGPEQAGAMYARLADLEAVRRRAEQVRDEFSGSLGDEGDPYARGRYQAALHILGET